MISMNVETFNWLVKNLQFPLIINDKSENGPNVGKEFREHVLVLFFLSVY